MFNQALLQWYQQNKRSLPWRKTKNPYKIWISEIMLQQTKVDSVIGYYQRFLEHFPTIEHLANAEEQTVLRLWQGLGYYSRARNLHYAAKIIQQQYNGIFPDNYKDILALKGIGTYTAAAISAFAYNLPYAVLDGNVFRVLARYYGIATPIDTTEGKKIFQQVASETMEKTAPEIYNQAIIEFGALLCTPRQPKCDICPVSINCVALKENTIFQLPVKSKKLKIRDRYFYYLVISNSSGIVLEKRTQKDIWQNMYQYPLIESDKAINLQQLTVTQKWENLFKDITPAISNHSSTIIHKLTHQNIYITFIVMEVENESYRQFNFIPYEQVNDYPLPKPIVVHFQKFNNCIKK